MTTTTPDVSSASELTRWRREAVQLLRNDGVTYHRYAGHGPPRSAWDLDPLPVVIAAAEWAAIERGLTQRAELLDLILTDLYGPRELIHRGLLPVEVVYGHRGFVRHADQIRLPGAAQLVLYAADVGRDASGTATVIADHAQSPAGAGYALENRIVTSRVLADRYRDAEVQRLASFFRTLRASFAMAAPVGIEHPRVVLLTPGAHNAAYFEHAFLARHLGYALVEGADLVVAQGRVWLRALGGLEPVDVIVRRVDGWYCDPLELRPDSRLGVAGLVEAARRGAVSIVNGIGANVVENAGLLPFLPRIARERLGQDLLLQSVETWWCGDDTHRSHVLANLDRLIVKSIARKAEGNAIDGSRLTAHERAEVRARIEARPHLFVGQLPPPCEVVPCVSESATTGLEPRRATMRLFAVATEHHFAVMPGALTQVMPLAADGAGGAELADASLGGLTKDTWVLAPASRRQAGFWLHGGPGDAGIDPAGSMSSRAAENLYWFGRYAERAEGTVRLVRAVLDRTGDFATGSDEAGAECLRLLLGALQRATSRSTAAIDGAPSTTPPPEHELLAAVFDRTSPGSVASVTTSMIAAAEAVRDQLSGDTWLATGPIDQQLAHAPASAARLQETLAKVMRNLLSIEGLAAESMVRDPGWKFMDAGRRLERAIHLATLIDATLASVGSTATDSLVLESVLIALECIITYRRRYRSRAQVVTALDLLLFDDANPRSLTFQLDRLASDVAAFPRDRGPRLSEVEQLVLELSTRVRLVDSDTLARVGSSSPRRREQLSTFLTAIGRDLRGVADVIDEQHFSRPMAGRVLVAGQLGTGETFDGSTS